MLKTSNLKGKERKNRRHEFGAGLSNIEDGGGDIQKTYLKTIIILHTLAHIHKTNLNFSVLLSSLQNTGVPMSLYKRPTVYKKEKLGLTITVPWLTVLTSAQC